MSSSASTTTKVQTKGPDWSTDTYSAAASFVPQLTTKLLQLLDPQPDDKILDIGCGDGKYTSLYSSHVTSVLGLDSSASFVESATKAQSTSHPSGKGNITFQVADCRHLHTSLPSDYTTHPRFTKITSNAALHWILASPSLSSISASSPSQPKTDPLAILQSFHALLQPGGHLIFEMGGAGNVAETHAALVSALAHHAPMSIASARTYSPWFFPSDTWMRRTLEGIGFEVQVCELEYRPTRLTADGGGKGGLRGWVELMGADFFNAVDVHEADVEVRESKRESMLREVVDVLRDVCGREDEAEGEGRSEWLGYVRLRCKARKRDV